MGDRDYAAEMAKLLDPSGRFFHGRVISAVSWLCGAASLGQALCSTLRLAAGKQHLQLVIGCL